MNGGRRIIIFEGKKNKKRQIKNIAEEDVFVGVS